MGLEQTYHMTKGLEQIIWTRGTIYEYEQGNLFSALYMNDTMVVSGSGAGIVKLWDLPKLLDMPVKMFSFKKWLKWFSSFFLNFPDCPSGRWDHPASEEDQHEGGPPLPHQGDLPVHLHWPCHHCKVRSSVITVEWPLVTRYEGKKKKDKVKIVEVSWNWLPMKAQARWFFSTKVLTPCQLPCVIYKPSDPTVIKLSVTYRSVLLHTFVFF